MKPSSPSSTRFLAKAQGKKDRRVLGLSWPFLLFLMFSGVSCLTILKVPSSRNAYSEMTEAEKGKLENAPDSSFFSKKAHGTKEEMELYEIRRERLFEIMEGSKNWVTLWATWCPKCKVGLERFCQLDQERQDLELILIAANYDPEHIREFAFQAGYRKPLFVIDAEHYGEEEGERIKRFARSITDGSKKMQERIKGVPHHFLFEGREWIGHQGGDMDSLTLREYFP